METKIFYSLYDNLKTCIHVCDLCQKNNNNNNNLVLTSKQIECIY